MKTSKISISDVQKSLYAAMTKIENCDEKMDRMDKKEIKSFIIDLQGMCSALDRIMILKEKNNSPF